MIALSILIVNWNTRELLRQCLQSIFATADDLGVEVLVVDNASTDGSASMIREHFPQVHLIENRENVGFARANNQALASCRGRTMLLLNSDTEVCSAALQHLVAALDAHPEAGAVGPKMLNPDGTFQNSYGSLPSVWSEIFGPYLFDFFTKPWGRIGRRLAQQRWNDETCLKTDRVSFACTLIRREALQATGILDEGYLFYSEDYDWFKRVKDSGWQVLFCPDAQVIHHWGASSRKRSDWSFSQLYRSKRMYYAKHYGPTVERLLRLGFIARFLAKCLIACIGYPMRPSMSRLTIRRYRRLIHEMRNPL